MILEKSEYKANPTFLILLYSPDNICILYFAVYNVQPRFCPKLSWKNILIVQLNDLFMYLFLFRYLFFVLQRDVSIYVSIKWYKKLYVTNNYKTQEQIHSIRNFMYW